MAIEIGQLEPEFPVVGLAATPAVTLLGQINRRPADPLVDEAAHHA